MIAMKRIMRYLKGTKEYGLYYRRSDRFELKVFTTSDWTRNIDDKKSISGGAFFLGKRLVSWTRKEKKCISQSTVKAEYVTVLVNYSNIM